MQYEWNGDEDLGDGTVQRLHTDYMKQRQFITGLGLKEREAVLSPDCDVLLENFAADEKFLKEGMEKARKDYEDKRAKQKSSDAMMMSLAWELTGFEELLAQCMKFQGFISHLKGRLCLPKSDQGNLKADVSGLRSQLLPFTKDIFGKKRKAASHLFVFMTADESRNMKTYAVPVRVLPFKSITDNKVRGLEEELRNVMTSIGMTVVGK